MLIDSHCHLSELSEDELAQTLQKARENDVEVLIAIGAGYGFEDNLKTLEIAKTHENIFCTLGMHPHDAKDVTEENFSTLRSLISENKKVVAVGEVGLDYHYMHSPRDTQREVLQKFAGLAVDLQKPIMIHDRDAQLECVEIFKATGSSQGIAHCFTGTKELAKKYLDLGFFISFSGIITFKKAMDLRNIVKFVPLEKILIETDSPFLAPEPFRGKKNEPAHVKFVAEKIAEIKGLPFDEIARQTSQNAKVLFGIV